MLKFFTKKSRGFTHSPFLEGEGFTLIELLVVVAIIGLLASIILVSVGPARAKARDAKRQSDLKQINLAMEMCYSDASCGPGETKYPVHAAGANTWTKIDNSDGIPLFLTMPSDPTNSGSQVYTWVAGNEQWYCIYTKLESVADTWFCASNKGMRQKTAVSPYVPISTDCCGVNVTI